MSGAPGWRVGLMRLVLAAWLWLGSLPFYTDALPGWCALPASWWSLTGPLAWLVPAPSSLPASVAPAVGAVVPVLAALATFGVGARVTSLALGLTALWLGATRAGFGFIDHELPIPAVALIILAASPGVDHLSVDQLLRRSRAWPERVDPIGPQVILLLLMLAYFAAGVAKLRFAGGAFVHGDSLTFYLAGAGSDPTRQLLVSAGSLPEAAAWRDGIGLTDSLYFTPSGPVGHLVAEAPLLVGAMSAGATIVELTAPLVFFGPRVRTSWLMAMILLHVGIGQFMNLPFFGYQLTCALLLGDLGVWRRPAARG